MKVVLQMTKDAATKIVNEMIYREFERLDKIGKLDGKTSMFLADMQKLMYDAIDANAELTNSDNYTGFC